MFRHEDRRMPRREARYHGTAAQVPNLVRPRSLEGATMVDLPATERPPFVAAHDRYASMTYRRTGRSGLDLPAISLGLWHNFGEDRPLATQRAIVRRAFDLGVTHFDLANNYGP